MSENQQPLEQEEQTAPQAEAAAADEAAPVQTADAPVSATQAEPLPATDDEAEPAPADGNETDAEPDTEEEEDIDPADVKIFGLPRVCFHFTAGGAAFGYIVCGLLGVLANNTAGTLIGDLASKTPNVTICAIACGAIGYLIGKRKYKKRLAAKEAALAAQENNTES